MIVTVTDEQKKVIESQGFTVIEFKMFCKKLADVFHGICDVWNSIKMFLQSKIFEVFNNTVRYFGEWIKTALRYCTQQICDLNSIEKPKYQFVKKLGTKYDFIYKRVTIYHCRNNC